ncbi:MAG TPA: hypothetical protein VE172_14600 [Stackebrandtia sp.]|jgi:hypothetical protein|uniref:hypothetical protein n=1 Tax=Stackebrandtia sp. TaxID=2023065 RepID=UPI002D2C42C6|nr:hypothetical protein [Stackebrandtia sp.]HZE40033.1 hypothetical protein [Stackebrandtia sp.]
MNPLVRLYPPSIRDAWGRDLDAEARHAGWRAIPNLALGAADAWLHPMIWPSPDAPRRRTRAVSLAITVALCAALLAYLATEYGDALPARFAHSTASDLPALGVLIGLLLMAPMPRVRALPAALARTARFLTLPFLGAAAVVLIVHIAPIADVPAPAKSTVLIAWWAALLGGAIQTARLAARLGPTATTPPGPARLAAGMWTVAASVALLAAMVVGFAAAGAHPLALVAGCGLALSSLACLATLRDLRELAGAGR